MKNNTKNRKYYYITSGIIIIILVIITFWKNTYFSYDIIDSFEDTTTEHKISFIFVEVNSLDSVKIFDAAKEIMEMNRQKTSTNDTSINVHVVHFFIPDDTISLPKAIAKQIRNSYPYHPSLIEKLKYISSGYIFSSFSRRSAGKSFFEDTLIKSPFIIPKKGIKAKDVLRIPRYKFKNNYETKPDTTGINMLQMNKNKGL